MSMREEAESLIDDYADLAIPGELTTEQVQAKRVLLLDKACNILSGAIWEVATDTDVQDWTEYAKEQYAKAAELYKQAQEV